MLTLLRSCLFLLLADGTSSPVAQSAPSIHKVDKLQQADVAKALQAQIQDKQGMAQGINKIAEKVTANASEKEKKAKAAADKEKADKDKPAAKPEKDKSIFEKAGDAIKNKLNDIGNSISDKVTSIGDSISGAKDRLSEIGGTNVKAKALDDAVHSQIASSLEGVQASQDAINNQGARPQVDRQAATDAANRGDIAAFKAAGGVTYEEQGNQQKAVTDKQQEALGNFRNLDDVVGNALKGASLDPATAKKLGLDSGAVNSKLGEIAAGPEGLLDRIANKGLPSDKAGREARLAELDKQIGTEEGKKLGSDVDIDSLKKQKLELLNALEADGGLSKDQKIDQLKTRGDVLKAQASELQTASGQLRLPPSLRAFGGAGTFTQTIAQDVDKATGEVKGIKRGGLSQDDKLNLAVATRENKAAQAQNTYELGVASGSAPEATLAANRDNAVALADKELAGHINENGTDDQKAKLLAKDPTTGKVLLDAKGNASLSDAGKALTTRGDDGLLGSTGTSTDGQKTQQSALQRSNEVLRVKTVQSDVGATGGGNSAAFNAAASSVANGKGAAIIAKGNIEALEKTKTDLDSQKTSLERSLRFTFDKTKVAELNRQIGELNGKIQTNKQELTVQREALTAAEKKVKEGNVVLAAGLSNPAIRQQAAADAAEGIKSQDPAKQQHAREILEGIAGSGGKGADIFKFNKAFGQSARTINIAQLTADNPLTAQLTAAYLGPQQRPTTPTAPTVTPTAPTQTASTPTVQPARQVTGETLEFSLGGRQQQIEVQKGDTLHRLAKTVNREQGAAVEQEATAIRTDPARKAEFDRFLASDQGRSAAAGLNANQKVALFLLSKAQIVRDLHGVDVRDQNIIVGDRGANAAGKSGIDRLQANPEYKKKLERQDRVKDAERENTLPGTTGEATPAKKAQVLGARDVATGITAPTGQEAITRDRSNAISHPSLDLTAQRALLNNPDELRKFLGTAGVSADKTQHILDLPVERREEAVRAAIQGRAAEIQGSVDFIQRTFGVGQANRADPQAQAQAAIRAQQIALPALQEQASHVLTQQLNRQVEALGTGNGTEEQRRTTVQILDNVSSGNPEVAARFLDNLAKTRPDLAAQLVGDLYKKNAGNAGDVINALDQSTVTAINRTGGAVFTSHQAGDTSAGGVLSALGQGISEVFGGGEDRRTQLAISGGPGDRTVFEGSVAHAEAVLAGGSRNPLVQELIRQDPSLASLPAPELARKMGPALAIYEHTSTASVHEIGNLPVDLQTKIAVTAMHAQALESERNRLQTKLDAGTYTDRAVPRVRERLAAIAVEQEKTKSVLDAAHATRNVDQAQRADPFAQVST